MAKTIKQNCVIPSSAFSVPRASIRKYEHINKKPEVGDLIYGEIVYVGQHKTIESSAGRIHQINDNTKLVFTYGNRYAPDYYEGFVPEESMEVADLLARSGMVGVVKCKNSNIGDPTKVKILGNVLDKNGNPVNTRDFRRFSVKNTVKSKPRSKMILCVGTSMNSGKSMAAAACCYSIAACNRIVRASKITGTASLKDILLMEDCGAERIADFTYLGYPSTYMLSKEELLDIFDTIDLKYANNKNNYWVVEIADGILQRETRMLLMSERVRSRIHKLVFCAQDAFGAISGLQILQDEIGLKADALSGVCSSSPLSIRELSAYTGIPVFNSMNRKTEEIFGLIK